MVDKLEACPFCGSGPARAMTSVLGGFSGVEMLSDGAYWNVWCGTCGVSAPRERTEQEAAKSWNQRPTPTEDARERVKVLEEALGRLSSSFRGNWAGMFRERADVIETVEKIAQEALLTYRATALGNKETDRHG